jgi:hypothetical protein
MSWRTVVCAWLFVACGGDAPRSRGPEPIELACQHFGPLMLAVAPETMATADTPRTFEVPEPLVLEMIRSGQVRFWYTIGVCGGASATRGDVTHSTGYPDLDQLLEVHFADLHLAAPSAGCTSVSLVITGLDRACPPRQTLD